MNPKDNTLLFWHFEKKKKQPEPFPGYEDYLYEIAHDK
jgi:hypothetical protein